MSKLSEDRLKTLKNEIKMSEKLLKDELRPAVEEAVARYTGCHTPRYGGDWDIILNEVYPIIQWNLPSIFFRNPRAFLKPRNKTFIAKRRNPVTGKKEEVQLDSNKSSRTQEHILNYKITQIKYKRETRKVLLDSLLFPHGVLWHGYKGEWGMTEEQSIDIKNDDVFVKRISPLRFIFDPNVTISTIDEAKWVGRIIDIPFLDIVEDESLDVDKSLKGFRGFGDKTKGNGNEVKEISVNSQDYSTPSGNKNIGCNTLIDVTDENFQNSKSSRFVRVYEIFLRPTKKEKREGKKGKILLLTEEQKKPLRENDWTIKAEGFPSKILQFNELNDATFGMPDIDPYKAIADQKNIITNIQIRNAQENTKNWIGISADSQEEQIQKFQNGENTIIVFPEDQKPSDKMFVATPGGAASSELYLIDQRIQKNLEDKSGVTDLKRGFLQSGEESAASVKIRAAGGGARPAYRQDIMSDFLKESYLYLNQLLRQFVDVKDAVRIVGSLDIEWSDNPSKEELQADVDVEIDVISMLPENPEKEIGELNTILQLMIQGLTIPEVNAKLQQEGKTINLSPIIEQLMLRLRIRDPEIFRNIKPEESEGCVSVQQMKQAQANVDAALSGQQVPFPPQPEDDHKAKLQVYGATAQLLQKLGQVSDTLNQLIQVQAALFQELQKKNDTPGQRVKLSGPTIASVGG